ncbi:major surface protein MSP1 subunit alpha [Anaplasma centrale]|uniref:major surface protein MSP1 subunit alpha n=1 Tax=Anaplasma centrale TaxID=769 RepID=UPI001EE5B6E4|nr:major surface protein MSP1a [Anaplasma centrale]
MSGDVDSSWAALGGPSFSAPVVDSGIQSSSQPSAQGGDDNQSNIKAAEREALQALTALMVFKAQSTLAQKAGVSALTDREVESIVRGAVAGDLTADVLHGIFRACERKLDNKIHIPDEFARRALSELNASLELARTLVGTETARQVNEARVRRADSAFDDFMAVHGGVTEELRQERAQRVEAAEKVVDQQREGAPIAASVMIGSEEYISAARDVIAVGVYAAQKAAAQSAGLNPLNASTVESIVNDNLTRSYFHGSGISLGSLRLIFRKLEGALGLSDQRINDGFASHLADAVTSGAQLAVKVVQGGSDDAELTAFLKTVEGLYSSHGGLVSGQQLDRGATISREDLCALVDFMLSDTPYQDGAAKGSGILDTISGYVNSWELSYGKLLSLNARTLSVAMSMADGEFDGVRTEAVSGAVEKFRIMLLGVPAQAKETPQAKEAPKAKEGLFSGVAPAVHAIIDPAKATVVDTCRKIRSKSMTSFSGVGQFVIAVTALLATIFAICACMEPTLTGPSGALIWGCLALVVLLPLLGMAIHAMVKAEEKRPAAPKGEFQTMLEDERVSKGVRILACVAVLAFIGAVIACMCVDVQHKTWHGSALLLSALVLFAVASIVIAVRGSTLAEEQDVGCKVAEVLVANDQQPAGGGASPDTLISSVEVEKGPVVENPTLQQQQASHLATTLNAGLYIAQ